MLFGAITLSLQLQRTSFDLLDGLNIEVAVHNTAKTPATVRFPAPTEYEIDVVRGDDVIWSSMLPAPPHRETMPSHVKDFVPGPTVLAIYIWNETTKDNRSLAPGQYTIRARLLGETIAPQASLRVRFTDPTPVHGLSALHAGDEVTIAGQLDSAKQQLTDSTGSIRLSKKLLGAPDATIAVRGYTTTLPDGTMVFYVQRWAPLSA